MPATSNPSPVGMGRKPLIPLLVGGGIRGEGNKSLQKAFAAMMPSGSRELSSFETLIEQEFKNQLLPARASMKPSASPIRARRGGMTSARRRGTESEVRLSTQGRGLVTCIVFFPRMLRSAENTFPSISAFVAMIVR